MHDLDWADVEGDAEYQHQMQIERIYVELDRLPTPDLEEARYWAGVRARQEGDLDEYRCADLLLLGRLVTHICECCFGRYGCQMCDPGPLDPMYDDPFYDDAFYAREGRPRFPNEY